VIRTLTSTTSINVWSCSTVSSHVILTTSLRSSAHFVICRAYSAPSSRPLERSSGTLRQPSPRRLVRSRHTEAPGLPTPDDAPTISSVTLCQISTLRMLLSLTNLAPLWAATVLEAPALLTTLARLVDSSRRSLQTHGGQVDEPKRKESPGSSPLSAAPTLQPSSILATSEAEGGSDIRPEDTPAAQLEILCLSLGLLSKLVETVDQTRALVRGTSVAPSCAETRTCVVACRCAGARSMLLVIVDLYEDQRHGTSAEVSVQSPRPERCQRS
jgi:hypothetical protein